MPTYEQLRNVGVGKVLAQLLSSDLGEQAEPIELPLFAVVDILAHNDQNVANDSWAPAQFDSGHYEVTDNHNLHVPGTSRFVIPEGYGGWYWVKTITRWELSDVGVRGTMLTRANAMPAEASDEGLGDPSYQPGSDYAQSGDPMQSVHHSEMVRLLEGEKLGFRIYQNSGGPLLSYRKLRMFRVAGLDD